MTRRSSERRRQRCVRRQLGRVALAVVASIGLAIASFAVSPTPGWADSEKKAKDAGQVDDPRYRKAYKRGRALFERKQWKAARKQFKKAYEISPQPILLFNIGSTYRREKNYIDALFHFHRYLEEAGEDAPYRNFARSAIDDLEAKIAEKEAAAKRKAKKPDPSPDVQAKNRATEAKSPERPEPLKPPKSPRVDDGGNRALQISGLGLAVVGLGAMGWGGYELRNARSKASDIEGLADNTQWSPELQKEYDDSKAAGTRAVIFGIAGGAAMAIGVVMYLAGQGDGSAEKPSRESVTWSPYSDRDSVGVIVSASF